VRVLLAPGTTGIAKEIFNSLLACKDIELYGCGFDLIEAQEMKYRKFFYVPQPESSGQVLNAITSIAKNSDIDAIFICHDEWLREVSITKLPSGISNKVVNLPNNESLHLLSKRETYKNLTGRIYTPTTYDSVGTLTKYPLFLKPDRGQGSRGAKIINSLSDLNGITITDSSIIRTEFLLCEFLPGEEFTIDCFSNNSSQLLYTLARKRVVVSDGIASETHAIRLPEVSGWLEEISEYFKLSGAWFAQFKRSHRGDLKLLEVGIRVAGASGINRALGVNLALMSLYQFLGQPIEVINQYHDAIYWQKLNTVKVDFNFKNVYMDFDDTITNKQEFNSRVVQAIYDLHCRGARIEILTRSKVPIESLLVSAGINHLISKINYFNDDSPKSSKIDGNQNFLFVDDSFKERKAVFNKFGLKGLTLDPSAFQTRIEFRYS